MVLISASPPTSLAEGLACYIAYEPLFEGLPVVAFIGNSTKANSTGSSSRIQAHIYSLAGFRSFFRLTVAPNASSYAAVKHLSAELQGDEEYRRLAISLLSYFAALSNGVKRAIQALNAAKTASLTFPTMFDEMHAGNLASRMEKIACKESIAKMLNEALLDRVLSWVDVDVVLPTSTLTSNHHDMVDDLAANRDDSLRIASNTRYTAFIESLGSPIFLPTTKLQRAPSKSSSRANLKDISQDACLVLQKELEEFLQTEARFVEKLQLLTSTIAPKFVPVLSESDHSRLFPPELPEIESLHEILSSKVDDILHSYKMQHREDINDEDAGASEVSQSISSKITKIGDVFCQSLRLLKSPYQHYFRASMDFTNILNRYLDQDSEAFAALVHDLGEQQLRSALIEPVQRLPRLTLFIDNLVRELSCTHAATTKLLKARDHINDICALDNDRGDPSTTTVRILNKLVSNWPQYFEVTGRLIAAVDASLMRMPFNGKDVQHDSILLLFAGSIVSLQKSSPAALSARGIWAELTSSNFEAKSRNCNQDHAIPAGLTFDRAYDLTCCRFSESANGRFIFLSENPGISLTPEAILQQATQIFELQAPYLSKASRFGDEVAKSRIEHRYPESIRESGEWQLHASPASDEGVGLILALSERKSTSKSVMPTQLGPIQIHVDSDQKPSQLLASRPDVQIALCLSFRSNGTCQLDLESFDGARSSESCLPEQIISRTQKRLEEVISLLQRSDSITRAAQQMTFDASILQRLATSLDSNLESGSKDVRSRSPVKMLTSVFAQPSNLLNRAKIPGLEHVPSMRTLRLGESAKSNHREHPALCLELFQPHKDAVPNDRSTGQLLDATFDAYVIALRSRKGNVVGKILQNRATADELAVNDLYNALLENPDRLELAAIASIDVLFAAFEKFLQKAWRERRGPVIMPTMVDAMQKRLDAGQPVVFASCVRQCLEEMPRQNQQTFALSIKLLSELLDASGNDGDRGVLIGSFAEALFDVERPLNHIQLLDRLVDDFEILLEPVLGVGESPGSPQSVRSALQRKNAKSGSISSNTSSLRKRLGLGITGLADISAQDTESRSGSLWRSLSKANRPNGDPSAQEDRSIRRSLSVDSQRYTGKPRSREENVPKSPSSALDKELPPNPCSPAMAHDQIVIGSNLPEAQSRGLHSPASADLSPQNSTTRPKSSESAQNIIAVQAEKGGSSQSQSHLMNGLKDHESYVRSEGAGSPAKEKPSTKLVQSNKENLSQPSSLVANAEHASSDVTKQVKVQTSPGKRSPTKTSIPIPRQGLSERAWPPNEILKSASNAPVSPKKASVSTQAQRRIAITSSPTKSSSLSPEITRSTRSNSKTSATASQHSSSLESREFNSSSQQASANATISQDLADKEEIAHLKSQVEGLRNQLDEQARGHAAQLKQMKEDRDENARLWEQKIERLDKLYLEVNAENEALYDRFNQELSKILSRVRSGESVAEMRERLHQSLADAAALRKENSRLKHSLTRV